jgi:hypothetical protein
MMIQPGVNPNLNGAIFISICTHLLNQHWPFSGGHDRDLAVLFQLPYVVYNQTN